MKHLQNQKNKRQKSNGLRQALNREVNIPECPTAFSDVRGIPNAGGIPDAPGVGQFASGAQLQR
jgi:hypothetical protein